MDVPTPIVATRKRTRLKEYLGVLVIIAAVVAAAFYQEQIGYFVGMHLWDKSAPGIVVMDFLAVGSKGDQKSTDAYLGSRDFHPLTKAGKWEGYFIATPAGKIEFKFAELAPQKPPAIPDIKTEFLFVGKGAAEVMMPDAKGVPVKYRLEMQNGAWKIAEILGGHASK